MKSERLTLKQAIDRYSGWLILDSNGSSRWILVPEETSEEAVHLILEGDWVTVYPIILAPGLGLKPQGRWNLHER